MADPNTRQGKRTPVTLKIKFKSETLEQFIERYAVDVSQGGIFIRTKEPLAVGTQMRFEFQLRDASPLIGGEGTVVWTRENDPSRPAIAPGMGVRFDRLAEGSQSVLERILAEKAKQAPQRPPDTTKPPMFTDTPTRVAPPPVQEALLGNDSRRNKRGSNEQFNDQHTPLPKPVPFHSDADEFPEEAFEEATKVRALDELIAQTADSNVGNVGVGLQTEPDLFGTRGPIPGGIGVATNKLTGLDELAARRGRDVADSPAGLAHTTQATPATPSKPVESVPDTLDPSSTSPGFASGATRPSDKGIDRESAPNLPSPPSARPRPTPSPLGGMGIDLGPPTVDPTAALPKPAPRLLDTTPSPRTDSADPMEKLAKTKLGMEPVHVPTRTGASSSAPPFAQSIRDAPTRPSGMVAVGSAVNEPTSSVRVPKKSSAVPIIILIFVLLAASGAGVWFFVLREKAVDSNGTAKKTPTPTPGSDVGSNLTGSDGSNKVAVGSNDGPGSNTPPPVGPPVEIEITSTPAKATIEVLDTDMKGTAPFKAKLAKDKTYKVRISLAGHATIEKDVVGGEEKLAATLDPKPRAIEVTSEPAGALIMIDNRYSQKSTPDTITLDKAQSAKKTVLIRVQKVGYRSIEKIIDASAGYTEGADKLLATVNVRLVPAPVPVRPPVGPGSGSGSATPPVGSGSDSNPDGSGAGSAPTPPPGGGSGGGSGGGTPEPTPDFIKDKDKQP